MSGIISDQRNKVPQGKNEESSIPWSQQVDEASNEISSPVDGNSQGQSNEKIHFQYPPFNYKDNCDVDGNYIKENRRYNNQSSEGFSNPHYNYYRKNDSDQSTSLKHSNSSYGNYNKKSNNYEVSMYPKPSRNVMVNRSEKTNFQRNMQNLSIDDLDQGNTNNSNALLNKNKNTGKNEEKGFANESNNSTSVKQMTWASVASQPAKPTLRANTTTGPLKKKGPGMPPPPMVPGKHNMDMSTWDSPKNGPNLVPPPPLPVVTAAVVDTVHQRDISMADTTKLDNEKATKQKFRDNFSPEIQSKSNWAFGNKIRNKQIENSNFHQASRISGNENIVRPPWVPQYQSQSQHLATQNQHSYSNSSKKNSGGDVDKPLNMNKYNSRDNPQMNHSKNRFSPPLSNSSSSHEICKEPQQKKNYNPYELDIEKAKLARFFVIKSYSEDDIYRSIKYEIWCSTDRGNIRLDDAFHERQSENGYLYLLFSVNGSGHFCGVAQMMTSVDYNSVSNVWSQKKWKGTFKVKWIYVKDVPNNLFRGITIETNENRPVTHSRDTQEVPNDKGILVLKIIHEYKHSTSLIDDFPHYEQRQEEEKVIKKHDYSGNMSGSRGQRLHSGEMNRDDISYENNKQNSYHRDRKSSNRSSYGNSFDNRRNNENKNVSDISTTKNNNRDSEMGENFTVKNNGFRGNYQRKDDINSGEARSNISLMTSRSDNKIANSFRDKERENYKKKTGWRTSQRSVDLNDKPSEVNQ